MEEYLGITEAKTALLISACCKAGALIGGAPPQVVRALAEYGRALGLLFQIADDLSDGDAAFPSEFILREKAQVTAGGAVAALDVIGMGAAAVMLRELPRFLLTRAMREAAP
jgi:hypothetical protein